MTNSDGTSAARLVIPIEKLIAWAMTKPTIAELFVFGSYARGEATATSDLDIALTLDPDDGQDLAELIENSSAWEAELSLLTGILVKDIYLSTDKPACGARVLVYRRGLRT